MIWSSSNLIRVDELPTWPELRLPLDRQKGLAETGKPGGGNPFIMEIHNML